MKRITTLLLAFLAIGTVQAQLTCEDALPITEGIYEVTNLDGALPTVSCAGSLAGSEYANWYVYIPTSDVSIALSSNVPGYANIDTRLSVYTGSCAFLECVDSDDDSGPGFSSVLQMNVNAGQTYYIVWDNYWNNGLFAFSLTEGEFVVNQFDFTSQTVDVSSMAVVDMNGDHLDDLVSPSGNNILFGYQQADGSFEYSTGTVTSTVSYSPSWSIAAGDLNGDGFNDLLYGSGSGASFIWSNGDETYDETHSTEYIFCQRTNMVDINSDGMLDAFVCHDVDPNVYFLNEGTNDLNYNQGGLGDTPDGGNYGSVWIDYDNDCDFDLFIAKCRGGDSPANINQMHRNNGDGTFTEVGAEIGLADNVQTWSSAWADYDNDGDMDAVVGASSTSNGSHRVMINNGDGTFSNITAGSGFDVFGSTGIEWAPGDFNNDGFVDVIGAGSTIMVNNGDWTFSPNSVSFNPGPLGDLNNDGFLDVVNGSTIHFNQPNENNWIKITTIGTESNKNGIGARVTVHTASGQQIRDVRSGEGFRYMSSLNTHFGIGADTEIEKITVCWPSGIYDEIWNPAINQHLTILEGENAVGVAEEKEKASFDIYPNPASDVLQIQGNLEGNATFRIMELSGKVVSTGVLRTNQIEVSSLSNGFYILEIIQNDIHSEHKFVKR